MGLTPKSQYGVPTLESPRHPPLLDPRAATLVSAWSEKHGLWAGRVVPRLALGAMALRAVLRTLDS
jgi:hypothetical protein